MKVLNDLLGYNDFKIYQDTSWFNFSLESVLLPNFIKINKNTKNILDLGTGNAPIPMILTTITDAKIYGIEIQTECYELAKESVSFNKLDNKITLINDNMKNLGKYFEPNFFDIIICNPPYFKLKDDSRLNDDIHKVIARHEKEIKLNEVIEIGKKYLNNKGKLALVHRTERFVEVLEEMKKNNINPKRVQFIYPRENSESNLFLIEGIKNGSDGLKIEKPLYIHDEEGNYLPHIKDIFRR